MKTNILSGKRSKLEIALEILQQIHKKSFKKTFAIRYGLFKAVGSSYENFRVSILGLEELGLITINRNVNNGRDKSYSMTDKGYEVLHAWNTITRNFCDKKRVVLYTQHNIINNIIGFD